MLPEILTALALIPDRYKERAFRYMGKLLPSSLTKPQYLEMLKAQTEQRLSSINERRLLNVCKVCKRTGEISGQETSNIPHTPDNPYEDDWLNTFENEACQKSSKEMQECFARILAGEIKKPRTFSIHTIKLLGQIDPEAASIFRTFCSGCVSFDNPSGSGSIYKSIFPTFEVGRFSNFLEKYGLNDEMLSRLQEFSLLRTVVKPSWIQEYVLDLQECFINNSEKPPIPFLYAGKYFLLKHHDEKKDLDWGFGFPGFFLSSIGAELINIVEPEPIEELTEDLREFFVEKGLELVEVELTNDKHWKLKR